MDTPSSRDNAEARERHHLVVASFKPGTVTINGVSYSAAVSQMAETFALPDKGRQKVQNVKVSISKQLLGLAPTQGESMLVAGKAYKIVEVAGFDEGNGDWHFLGQRTPGGDR